MDWVSFLKTKNDGAPRKQQHKALLGATLSAAIFCPEKKGQKDIRYYRSPLAECLNRKIRSNLCSGSNLQILKSFDYN